MAEEKSRISSLNDKLYSRTRYEDPFTKRPPVRPVETPEVAHDWQGPELDEILTRERRPMNTMPFFKKLFIFSAIFFGISIVVALIVFFGGSTFISSKNLDIKIVGPTTASAGELTELEVTVENNNNAELALANFSIQYPSGARDSLDSSKQLTFSKESLGTMRAGGQAVRNVRFYLIGQMGEVKELKFSVEYKVKGSNATFYKDKSYEVTIGNTPVSINVSAPTKVDSGQEFSTTASITLNSTEVLKNVMLRAEYPYGYTQTSSSPENFSDNVWALGDMAPGSTKKVVIKGRLVGENQDERTLRFYVGSAEGDSPVANFKSTLISTQKTIAVDRPAVEVKLLVNGDDSVTYVAPAGQLANTVISYRNNLSQKLLNPKLELRLSGGALDKSTIMAYNEGFYNSVSSNILWQLKGLGGSELGVGESGSVSARFGSFADPNLLKGTKDITIEVVLTGTPVGSNTQLSVSDSKKIKIASQVSFNAKTLYSTGAFRNTGPMPPRAEATTTYSIVWTLGNTQNDVTESRVTAQLAPAVKWVKATSLGSEDISYDENTNTVTWNVGTLASGTGFSTERREVTFQISLTPSTSQVGTTPTLVNAIAFTGVESLAQKNINIALPALNTQMPNDPQFIQGDGQVQKK